MKKILAIILLLTSFLTQANTCENSLTKMLEGGDIEGEKLQTFLNLQAGITLHRLAYAGLRHSRSKEQFRIENTILELLAKVDAEKQKDPAFREVSELFNHPENKLSRTALSKVLPHIKDIINEQAGEQSAFKKKFFNIGLSDVRMLAILAEKEREVDGEYIHSQFTDRAYDQSILNFTKIINSSVRNSKTNDMEHMLNTMEQRLDELNRKALDLLVNMGLPAECVSLLHACVVRDDKKVVIEESFLNLIGKVIEDSNTINLHDQLRYNDVWLHINSKVAGTPAGDEVIKEIKANTNANANAKKELLSAPTPYIIGEKSDEEIVDEYLAQKVLDNVPYFFTKEELLKNKNFTRALAKAIDGGILNKKGKDRSFVYAGKEYYLPEIWNSEYSLPRGIGGRAGKNLSKRWHRLFRFDDDVDTSHIPEEDRDNFLTTLNDQLKDHDHSFSFEFKDKLYDIKTGKPIKKGLEYFLTKFGSKEVEEVENSEPTDIAKLADEIKKGNHSFVQKGKVYHISGEPVSLELESKRARKVALATDAGSEDEKLEFPNEDELDKLNDKFPTLTLKLLADRKRADLINGKVFDLYKGRSLTDSEAFQVVSNYRQNLGVRGKKGQIQEPKEQVLNDTVSILSYGKTKIDLDGWRPHHKLLEKKNNFNTLSNKDKVVQYFSENNKACPVVGIVDKEQASFELVKIDGEKPLTIYSTPIKLGAQVGDEKTVMYSPDKYNNKTGAGIFSLNSISKEEITLVNPRDPNLLSTLKIEASHDLEDILSNPRSTNGEIGITKKDLDSLRDYLKPDCQLAVLPETDDVEFKLVEDQLKLMPKKMSEFSLDGVDGKKSVNDYEFSPAKKLSFKPITISLIDDEFKSKNTEKFLKALEDEKRFIMEDTGLTNDQYNELAKLAFGIMGTESSFGEGDSNMGLNLYKFKESNFGQAVVSYLKSDLNMKAGLFMAPQLSGTIGLMMKEKHKIRNSRGMTQIKNVRRFFNYRAPGSDGSERYPEINWDSLDDPRNAAIATMYALAHKYEAFSELKDGHSAITDENEYDYLYYLYTGSPGQVSEGSATPEHSSKIMETNSYANKVVIMTK